MLQSNLFCLFKQMCLHYYCFKQKVQQKVIYQICFFPRNRIWQLNKYLDLRLARVTKNNNIMTCLVPLSLFWFDYDSCALYCDWLNQCVTPSEHKKTDQEEEWVWCVWIRPDHHEESNHNAVLLSCRPELTLFLYEYCWYLYLTMAILSITLNTRPLHCCEIIGTYFTMTVCDT